MSRIWEWLEEEIGKIPTSEGKRLALIGLASPFILVMVIIFFILAGWDANVKAVKKSFTHNHIEVKVVGPLVQERVRIDWKMDYTKAFPIYEYGETTYTEFFESGENHFLIFYENEKVAELIHLKNEGLSGHKYSFQLSKSDFCFRPSLAIEGKYDSIRWVILPDCH